MIRPSHSEQENAQRNGSDEQGTDKSPPWNGRFGGRLCSDRLGRPYTDAGKLFRQHRIASFVCVKIYHRHGNVMLHLAVAEIVQVWLPVAILLEICRNPFRQKNVSSVAAIHHALGHIDAATGNV